MEHTLINESEKKYLQAYKESLSLWPVRYKEYYVTTAYGQTYVIEIGNEDLPPMVLLHGGSMSSTMWYPNIQAWSKEYRVFAIDIMGDKNKSIVEKEFIDRRTHSDWLKEVLDVLSIQQADVVGLSFGALHTINFLLHEPGRVKKAVLMSPAETFLSFDPLFYSYAFGMIQNQEGVKRFLQWIFNDRYHLHPLIQNQLEAAMMWVDIKRTSKPGKSGFPYVFSDKELASIQTPILLLLGEKEVMYDPLQAMDRAKKVVPNIKVEIIKGVGHLLSIENPTLANERTLVYIKEGR